MYQTLAIHAAPRNPARLFPPSYDWTQHAPPSPEMSLADTLAGLPRFTDEHCFHEDLTALEDGALQIERERVRFAIVINDRPHWWVLERLGAIDAELEVRRATR